MVIWLLKLDYALSKWFAGKNKPDKIIPGAAFLFLNKASFVGLIILIAIAKIINIHRNVYLIVALGVIFTLLIMTGLQKKVESIVTNANIIIDYEKLNMNQVCQRRMIALLIFIMSFYSMMFVLIVLFR